MNRSKRSQLILQMTYRELLLNLVVTQFLFLLLSLVLSFFLFETLFQWDKLIAFSLTEMFFYGVFPGLVIVAIDCILMKRLPKESYDDGGLNEKLFSEAPKSHVFFIALLVAVSEEIFFRGLIQTLFGVYIASILFALIHFRYIKKPILFLSVLFLSFSLGFLYKWTGNLLIPITMHFTVDLILGLIIRRKGQLLYGQRL